jgi:AcrR family transcriptional regulator
MGSPERRRREREEKRAAICRAAMKLFLAEGFDKVTIRRIAEEIEYTPGAIYSYFASKDEIFYDLHSEGFRLLHERLVAVPAALPAFPRLREMGRTYLRFALDNPEYYDLMFILAAPLKQVLGEERWKGGLETYDLLRQQVRLCQSEGSLPAHDLEGATLALWAMVHGIASLVVKERLRMVPPEHLDAMVESAYEFGLKGIRRQQP